MQNPLCNKCNCLVSNPIETKDGRRVCSSCFNGFNTENSKIDPPSIVLKSTRQPPQVVSTYTIPPVSKSESLKEKAPEENRKEESPKEESPKEESPKETEAEENTIVEESDNIVIDTSDLDEPRKDETPVETPKPAPKKTSRRRR